MLTKTYVGARQADCGAWEVVPGKKLLIRWPAGSPSLDRIKICCENKNGSPPGGCVADSTYREPHKRLLRPHSPLEYSPTKCGVRVAQAFWRAV